MVLTARVVGDEAYEPEDTFSSDMEISCRRISK